MDNIQKLEDLYALFQQVSSQLEGLCRDIAEGHGEEACRGSLTDCYWEARKIIADQMYSAEIKKRYPAGSLSHASKK